MATPNPALPFYGSTREAIVAQGLNPDLVEAGRLAAAEGRQQQAIDTETEITARALEAVQDGELTWAEAAQALAHAGYGAAHNVVVQAWRAEEAADQAEANAYELEMMDAEEYAQHVASQQARERAQLAAQAQEAARQLEAVKLQGLIDQFKQFTDSTPGAGNIAPNVEKRIVSKIAEAGAVPATTKEQGHLIESALREEVVVSDALESIDQQVAQEWRIQRKQNGKTGELMTAADLAAAELHYRQVRTQQLLAEKKIDTEALKPQPSASEESAALAERYRARNQKSDDFHQSVAEMRQRGIEAEKKTGGAPRFVSNDDEYRAAVARAEAKAAEGEAVVRTGYNPEAVGEAAVDEYGKGGY